jgi:tight adherence protein C
MILVGILLDVLLVGLLLATLLLLYLIPTRQPAGPVSQAGRVARVPSPSVQGRIGEWYHDLLRQSGLNPSSNVLPLLLCKFFLGFFLPLFLGEVLGQFGSVLPTAGMLIAIGVVGFCLPELWLMRVRSRRRERIRRALSYFLDLVVALLHSGLNLDRAVLRAGRDGFSDPHPLADEVAVLGRELDMGRERSEAFQDLARRTGVVELGTIAAALRLGHRTGSGMEDTLESQADLLRFQYRELGLRRVNRSTVLSMIPVFLCGIPIFAVIVFFPASLEILETLRQIRPF